MSNLVYTRYITLRNGKTLDAHDYGKQVFVFEGDPNFRKRKKASEEAIKKIKIKLAESKDSDES